MEQMFVLDYKGIKHFLEIPVADVESVDVAVWCGDEVATFHLRNGKETVVDAGDFIGGRLFSERDGKYTVTESDFPKWLRRKNSYDWW